MYIEKEKWKKLINEFKKIYSNYDYFSDDFRNLIDNVDICIEDIEQNKSNKVYVITNNAICDDEIIYDIKGVAFNKNDATKLFEEAIIQAKLDSDFDNLDAIDVSDGTEFADGNWHVCKSDEHFELYLEGEYNSNNFTISIKEYDIDKNLVKDKEVDL